MIQINLLFINLNIHLHCYMLEVFRVILPQVPDVVVADNKVYFPVQPVQNIYPFGRTSQTEVAQVKHDILRTDHAVPVGNHRFIHVRYILERSVTELDYISVIEVGVGCKEHPVSVKFIIHNLFIHVHHCTVNNTLQSCLWTELTEKGASCERHQQAHNKKPSESLVRTLRRFSFIVSAGYQHHRIPDGLSNIRRKMSPKVLNAPMPEVLTYNILSRHFMPRSDTVFQLFILLCSIVNFIFDLIYGAKLLIFLRSNKFL